MRSIASAIRWVGLTTLVVAVLALVLVAHTWFAAPLRLDWLFSRFVVEQRWADPERMSLQPDGLSLLRNPDSRLTSFSPQSRAADLARYQRYRVALASYDCSDYDIEQRQSCDVFGYLLDQRIDAYRWRHFEHPVNPLFGLQITLPQLLNATAATVDRPQAGRAYLARLRSVRPTVEGWLQVLREQQAAGILPPPSMVTSVLADLRGFVDTSPSAHPLMVALSNRLDQLSPAAMPLPIADLLLADAAEAIETSVYPAWHALLDHFTQLRAQPLNQDGVWSLPEGEDYYQWAVAQQTTAALSPDELHQLGLDEVVRIGSLIDAELMRLGLESGAIGDRLRLLAQQPSQRWSGSEKALLISEFRQMLERAQQASAGAFNDLPDTSLAVHVVPLARQRSAPGAYYLPSPAAGEPAVVFLNLRALDELPRFSLRTLAHHEGVPGHHLQSAWMQRNADLPEFRRQLAFAAYAEGWAMYAEQLAAELGLNVTTEERIGQLQSELFRAARLVVDTGLHRKRWSSDQAIAYLQSEVGLGPVDARAEVERYLIFPGQALAFHVGLLRFRSLRQMARTRLGGDFDLAQFHGVVLSGGRLPLNLLDRRVEHWIAQQAGPGEARVQ